ncbi:MAG: hypothetical protein JWN93_1575 [Hyphomicrobiales bacterium]|nr:hypothetical protein [Hyphomicrobiales bacterium]
MPGPKTHEQQIRTFERNDAQHGKSDVPKETEAQPTRSNAEMAASVPAGSRAERSEAGGDLSRGHSGRNQESREHNKHNHQTQGGHKPQKMGPENEKH